MKYTGALLVPLLLCPSAFSEVDCSSQGLAPGTYFISSAMNDNRCLDKRSQDADTIQFYFCNGTKNQQFEFGEKDANGCYRIKVLAIPGPEYRYLAKYTLVSGLGNTHQIQAKPSAPDRWFIRSIGAGAYKTFNGSQTEIRSVWIDEIRTIRDERR